MMKILRVLVLMFVALSSYSQTFTNKHKSYVEIGFCGGTNGIGATTGVFGAAGLFFESFGRMSAIDARAKELYIFSPQREAGAITLTYRLFIARGFYLGAGFSHNHEIAMNDFLSEPVRAVMGNSKHIIHRSGLAAEIGYDMKPFPRDKWLGIYPVFNLGMSYLAMDNEPNPMITASVGFRVGMKKLELKQK